MAKAMSRLLLDTGPLVAMIDEGDQNHDRCVAWFKENQAQYVTTEAVLTEAMHLLKLSYRAQSACVGFFISGAVELHPVSMNDLKLINDLMRQYQNVPMDYADATLVNLANQLKCYSIFTLDVTDFSIYRPARNIAFTIYPPPL